MEEIEEKLLNNSIAIIKKYRNYTLYNSIYTESCDEIKKDSNGIYYPYDFFELYDILISLVEFNHNSLLTLLLEEIFNENDIKSYVYMLERLQTFLLNNDNSYLLKCIIKNNKISKLLRNFLYKIDYTNALSIIYESIENNNQIILTPIMAILSKILDSYYVNNRPIEILDCCVKYSNLEAFDVFLQYAKTKHRSLYEMSSNLYTNEKSIFNFIYDNKKNEFLKKILSYNREKSINEQLVYFLYKKGEYKHCLLLQNYKILKSANYTIFKMAIRHQNTKIINEMWFDSNIMLKRSLPLKKMALPFLNQAKLIIDELTD
jgi:hypothetical protein